MRNICFIKKNLFYFCDFNYGRAIGISGLCDTNVYGKNVKQENNKNKGNEIWNYFFFFNILNYENSILLICDKILKIKYTRINYIV